MDWYDREGKPISDMMEFGRLHEDLRYKYVAKARIGDAKVSTVWLGHNHQFGDGPPLIFETMIFGGERDCIPAAAVGSPQLRARIWILAYPRGYRESPDSTVFAGGPEPEFRSWWASEPEVGRVVDGVPAGLDRVRVNRLGNSLVPAIPEWIAERLMEVA